MVQVSDVIALKDDRLAASVAARAMPMETLIEAYLDGAADIPDNDAFLDARSDLVEFSITPNSVFLGSPAFRSASRQVRIDTGLAAE